MATSMPPSIARTPSNWRRRWRRPCGRCHRPAAHEIDPLATGEKYLLQALLAFKQRLSRVTGREHSPFARAHGRLHIVRSGLGLAGELLDATEPSGPVTADDL